MKAKIIRNKNLVFLIIGLLITLSITARPQTLENKENEIKINWIEKDLVTYSEEVDFVKYEIEIKPMINLRPFPLYRGMHPAIATNGQLILVGYDDLNRPEGTEFIVSSNGGRTWTEGIGWRLGESEYASIDHWADNRFIGTITPDPLDSGELSILDFYDVTDPYTWFAGFWNFEPFYFDFQDIQFAACDNNMEDWRVGFWSWSGYCGDNGYDLDKCPMIFFLRKDGYGTISHNNIENCSRPASDIDKFNSLHYAVWQIYNQTTGLNDIFFRIDSTDYIPPNYPDVISGIIVSGINHENIDICAHKDNVIIVAESDGSIVAYYTLDGINLNILLKSVEIGSGTNPRITEKEDGAIVIFVKNDVLFITSSSDGGASWSTPTQFSENTVVNGYHEADISEAGVVYTDTDGMIYFEPELEWQGQHVSISEISGGVGVTVEVENIGDTDVEDVPYTITATGGLLGMINKEVQGTVSVPKEGSTTISFPPIIGLGQVSIKANVESASKTVIATQILVYTSI